MPEQSNVNEIITKAKAGDPQAKNQLISIMQDNNCLKAVGRYLRLNRLLEPDDVRSEFWVGVVLAIPKVSTTIGDPLFYLSWSGVNRVKSQLRKAIGKGVLVICKECGHKGRLHRVNKQYTCVKCGAPHQEIETYQKEINLTTLNKNRTEDDEINPELQLVSRPKQYDVDLEFDLEEIRKQLTPQELYIFELIESGVNRENESNYLQAIATRLEVSPQRVSQCLKRIRAKMEVIMHLNIRKEKKVAGEKLYGYEVVRYVKEVYHVTAHSKEEAQAIIEETDDTANYLAYSEPSDLAPVINQIAEVQTCERGHVLPASTCGSCGKCRKCVEEGFEHGCQDCS